MTPNLLTAFAKKRLSQQRKPSLRLDNPSPYLYSQRGEGHGYAQSRVLREKWMDVFDNYEEGFKVGYPYVHLLGSKTYQIYGRCPTCTGPVLTKKDDRRSAIPFCPHCRKQFTMSEFNWNQRGNLTYNPDFETVGVEKAWNQPLPSEAQFDMRKHSPDPYGNSSGVRQY